MTQEIERVFNAARTFKRAGIDRHAQRTRKFAPVKATGLASKLDRALEQSTVHICPNQTIAKVDQRALRERRCVRSKPVEHHLDAEIDDGELDHLCIRDTEVRLNERGHRHQCWRHRRLPGSCVAIHRRKLVLKGVVKQPPAMHSQEPEQLSHAIQSLHQRLLLPTQLFTRLPVIDAHPSTRSRRRIEVDPPAQPRGTTPEGNRSAI